jgi:biotin transport system substrate-specific component
MKTGALAVGEGVLADLMFGSTGKRSLAHNALIALAASLLLWASAKAKVDIGVVPVTLQSLAVLALGAALGPRLAAAAVLAYLAQGALGLPVFAGTPEKGIGLAYMVGPTGGYLLGFLIAAVAIGWLAERGADRSPVRMFLAMLAATALIYVPGALWLSAFVGLEKALALGVAPFLAGDVIKAALAAAVFPAVWALARRD